MNKKTDSKGLFFAAAPKYGGRVGFAGGINLSVSVLRTEQEITLYEAQIFSLHRERRTKDPRPKIAQVISCTFLRLVLWLVFLILTIAGCSTTQNYAPVRPYQRDLVNSEKYYIVKQGDTLYSIGFRSGHGYKRLSNWNKILPPYKLQIGQKIKLFVPKQKLRVRKEGGKKNTVSTKKRNSSQKTSTISNNNKKVLKLYWQWPIKGKVLKTFSQTGSKGIDIYGKLGQKVRSAASGKVVYSGSALKGYGNLLIIKHNYLYLSAYANNRSVLVKEGQVVKKGQVIAEVGRVGGKQTSLHFEIRKNGNPVNPVKYLPRK